MDLAQIIGVSGVLLILFGAPLLYAARAAGGFIAARMPKRTPVSFAGIFKAKLSIEWWKVFVLLACLWLMAGGGGFKLPTWNFPSLTTKVDAVTYVHEQRSGTITPAIRAALSALNDKGVNANEFDQDTVNKGGGTVPKQYVVPLAAAKQVGLPAAVSTAGNRVLKAIKDPKAEDILALAP